MIPLKLAEKRRSMKKKLVFEYEFFEDYEQLNREEYRKLFLMAKESAERAQAPYSNFKVGASAITDDGQNYVGFNVENAAYPQCLCAEQVLLANIKTNGSQNQKVLTIAIYSPDLKGGEILTPCGACRQILREQESRQEEYIKLILANSTNNIYFFDSVSDLLPFSFNAKSFSF